MFLSETEGLLPRVDARKKGGDSLFLTKEDPPYSHSWGMDLVPNRRLQVVLLREESEGRGRKAGDLLTSSVVVAHEVLERDEEDVSREIPSRFTPGDLGTGGGIVCVCVWVGKDLRR